ncbi:hypothetical protein ACWNXI_02895 [Caldibacillus thermoamylovorans]
MTKKSETTNLLKLVLKIGLKRFIHFHGFYFGILSAVSLYYILERITQKQLEEFYKYLGDTIVSVSSSLLGIVIAGLALLIAILKEDILKPLYDSKLLQKFLVPFWVVSWCWGLSTVIGFFINVGSYFCIGYMKFIAPFNIFFFVYGTFATIDLLGNAIKITLIIAKRN